MLAEGPTTYSLGDLRDATKLAQKIVQSYGMTDLGITMHAPKQHALGFMKRAFEVRARDQRWLQADTPAAGQYLTVGDAAISSFARLLQRLREVL